MILKSLLIVMCLKVVYFATNRILPASQALLGLVKKDCGDINIITGIRDITIADRRDNIYMGNEVVVESRACGTWDIK
jgi:hypothetical protein